MILESYQSQELAVLHTIDCRRLIARAKADISIGCTQESDRWVIRVTGNLNTKAAKRAVSCMRGYLFLN